MKVCSLSICRESATPILFLWILLASCKQSSKVEADQPNILFCITDDQSWVHTSFGGEKAITTPAFDRIAKEGLYFSNAFCASPSCSPSRGSIITGQEVWRLGEAAQLFSAVPKKLEAVSFPLLLEDAGYQIGYTQKGWAPNDFKVHGWDKYPLGERYVNQQLEPPANKIVANDYAANFIDFLDTKQTGSPFFFWFGSSEPHRAFEPGSGIKNGIDTSKIVVPGFLPDVPEIRDDLADYLLEIKWVDDHLVKMIAELEKRDLLDNTIIIFTSDNGMAFPGAKNNLYEYGLHMPLAIRWPEGIKTGGRIIDDLVSLTDLAPTLLQSAGVEVPTEMTGKDMLAIFNSGAAGQVDKTRKYVFAGKERHTACREGDLPYPQRSVRDKQFLYIRNLEPDRWPVGSPTVKSSHNWFYGDIDESPSFDYLLDNQHEPKTQNLFLLATSKRPYEELFDIENDPFCLNNLIGNNDLKKDKERLSKALDYYLLETGDPRTLIGKSIWDDFPYYFNNPKGIVPYSDLNKI
jgi:N-sulfoglucosamine sulfohydrolase